MLWKKDVDLIPDTSCYAERHSYNIGGVSYLLFLADLAGWELRV